MNKRLETIAWGSFLILLGGFMFVPKEIIKGGWWTICIGLLFLGLNAARYFKGLRMSGFTVLLGILSVIGGVLDLVGVEGVNGAILIIVLGAYLILRPFFEKRQMFGKAEHPKDLIMQSLEIRVEGHLDKTWSEWLDGFTLTHTKEGETILTGEISEQAGLYGLLAKLRDLGVVLISIDLAPRKTD